MQFLIIYKFITSIHTVSEYEPDKFISLAIFCILISGNGPSKMHTAAGLPANALFVKHLLCKWEWCTLIINKIERIFVKYFILPLIKNQ